MASAPLRPARGPRHGHARPPHDVTAPSRFRTSSQGGDTGIRLIGGRRTRCSRPPHDGFGVSVESTGVIQWFITAGNSSAGAVIRVPALLRLLRIAFWTFGSQSVEPLSVANTTKRIADCYNGNDRPLYCTLPKAVLATEKHALKALASTQKSSKLKALQTRAVYLSKHCIAHLRLDPPFRVAIICL
jgi:hypothetical protein